MTSPPPRVFHSQCPECSEQDSNLHQRDSHSRASAGWATGAKSSSRALPMDRGGNRTLIVRVQAGCLPVRRRALLFFSVARRIRTFILELRRLVLIRLSYRNMSFNDPGRIRTCTKLVLSQPPLPGWATGPNLSTSAEADPASLHRAGLEPA